VTAENVLEVSNLNVDFATERGRVKALRNVDLSIPRGSIVGVVGESGCGKSTMINTIIGLLAHNARISSGTIEFEGSDLLQKSERELRDIRGTRISMVFQDPMVSLNPVLSIGTQMIDIQYRDALSKTQKKARSIEMLNRVGIPDAESRLRNYPHQFSGGMRQRIAIAMALQAEPALLIADEPTTALDATLEVQIIHRLRDLQHSMGCSILFISHHLGVIAELCDYVIVMYGGEVVERGSVRDIFHRPAHPYTCKLLECDPARIAETTRSLPTIPGEIPDLANLPRGCIFADRCDRKVDICSTQAAPTTELATQHWARCHLARNELST
jgi:oligopeptide/dipeptide ABC transporter ATP-binding protein